MIGRKADRVDYGGDESQFVEVWDAPGSSALTAVFVHGGFWRAAYKLDLMDGLCADAVQRGWRAINVEYRRGAGWPAMADDIRAAWGAAVEIAGDEATVTVGHSAGGHLALWAAAMCEPKPAVVVSLAGVVDLGVAQRLGLGGGAVDELLRDESRDAADPSKLVPIGVPTLLVAPPADNNVPYAVAQSYVEKARAAGDRVALIEPPGDHMAVIDPHSEAWATTCAAITAQLAEPGAGE